MGGCGDGDGGLGGRDRCEDCVSRGRVGVLRGVSLRWAEVVEGVGRVFGRLRGDWMVSRVSPGVRKSAGLVWGCRA